MFLIEEMEHNSLLVPASCPSFIVRNVLYMYYDISWFCLEIMVDIDVYCIKKVKVKSVGLYYEPRESSVPELIPVSTALSLGCRLLPGWDAGPSQATSSDIAGTQLLLNGEKQVGLSVLLKENSW